MGDKPPPFYEPAVPLRWLYRGTGRVLQWWNDDLSQWVDVVSGAADEDDKQGGPGGSRTMSKRRSSFFENLEQGLNDALAYAKEKGPKP